MNTEEIKNRIAKKEEEIAKTEKLLNKYLLTSTDEEKEIIAKFLECGEYSLHRPLGYTDAWGKAVALYDARNCLAKYQKQLEAQEAKEKTVSDMPEVIKEFAEDLFNRWNEYDAWKQKQIRAEIKNEPAWSDRENYRQWHRDMRDKWGVNYYEFAYLPHENIVKANKAAVDALVLNLIERTTEIAGKITDAKCLVLDRDNAGYAIINGIVIGEKGKARVESIGAGGYNIQRYHIRVLVKEVRD